MDRPRARKGTPYWLALVIGIAVTCILMNLLTILLQLGAFNPWQSLNRPSTGADRILNADYTQVLVKTTDEGIFVASIVCGADELCNRWTQEDDVSDILIQPFPLKRGTSCEALNGGLFPFDPRGRLVECVYAVFPGTEMGEEVYFALLDDGSVRYWENGGSILATQAFFIISTLVFPLFIALAISMIYLFRHLVGRARKRKSQTDST